MGNVLTAKDLKNVLEAYPDDWPIAWTIIEPEDIFSCACEMGIELSAEQINKVLAKISKIIKTNRDELNTIINEIAGNDYTPYQGI